MDPDSPNLQLCLLLDSLATRYHQLPSQVLAHADTLDYYVMDVSMSYHNYQRERAEAQAQGRPPTAPAIPVNKLQEMMERVRR